MMVKGPLPDRIEFAILQILMRLGGRYDKSMAHWRRDVEDSVAEFVPDAELTAAFKRLWKQRTLRLWNSVGKTWDDSRADQDDDNASRWSS
jgi:hypothetical protein